MKHLDKTDFLKVLEIEKPKVIQFKKCFPFFGGKCRFYFIHNKYMYETTCYDCKYVMEGKIKELNIEIVEI